MIGYGLYLEQPEGPRHFDWRRSERVAQAAGLASGLSLVFLAALAGSVAGGRVAKARSRNDD